MLYTVRSPVIVQVNAAKCLGPTVLFPYRSAHHLPSPPFWHGHAKFMKPIPVVCLSVLSPPIIRLAHRLPTTFVNNGQANSRNRKPCVPQYSYHSPSWRHCCWPPFVPCLGSSFPHWHWIEPSLVGNHDPRLVIRGIARRTEAKVWPSVSRALSCNQAHPPANGGPDCVNLTPLTANRVIFSAIQTHT